MRKVRLPLTFLGILFLAVLFPLFLNTYKNVKISLDGQNKQLEIATEIMKEALAEAIMLGDIYGAGRTLSQVCNVLGVVSCRIVDPTNKELYIYPSNSSHHREHRFSSFPITYGGKPVGRIEYEEKPIHWYELMQNEIALVLGFILLLGLIGYFVIRWLEEESQLAVLGKHSQHVGHNIQSPLAALRAIYEDEEFKELSEAKRILFRSGLTQIEDISNKLMHQHRREEAADELAVQPVASLIEAVISEKRSEYCSHLGIEIKATLKADGYGFFAKLKPSEFKSILSNLINNSVEAMKGQGTINVSSLREGADVVILVEDNGKGIPKRVVPKLMKHGVTFNKKTGHGWGLAHAKNSIEEWSGSIGIRSKLGTGTTIEIRLPQEQPPQWFVPEIEVVTPASVVVLDDDRSIHQVWNQRLGKIEGVEVVNCQNRTQLEEWYHSHKNKPALFLIDFELSGKKGTGLDVIESLGIGEESILITSRSDERAIISRCLKLGVRLIPKAMAAMVPISVQEASRFQTVLIDDDDLTRTAWRSVARDYGIRLGALSTPHQFISRQATLQKDITVYVDSQLGNGVCGEEAAKHIYDLGFKNIVLATGYPASSFTHNEWITKIVNKTPPWLKCGGIN